MARTLVRASLRIVYQLDGRVRRLSISRFDPAATDEGILQFKNAVASLMEPQVQGAEVTTLETVEASQ
jgi:hypothetical protein